MPPFVILHSANELHETTSRLKPSDIQRDVKAQVPERWMTQAETLGLFPPLVCICQ